MATLITQACLASTNVFAFDIVLLRIKPLISSLIMEDTFPVLAILGQ